NQVEEWEQENPHDIDKVPVESRQLDQAGVLSAESTPGGHDQNDHEDYQPAENVQGVESGHGEIARRPGVAPGNNRRQVPRLRTRFLLLPLRQNPANVLARVFGANSANTQGLPFGVLRPFEFVQQGLAVALNNAGRNNAILVRLECLFDVLFQL